MVTPQRSESKLTFGLMFFVHQVIATYVVFVSSRILLASAFNVLGLLGWHSNINTYYWLVNGMPFFPLQVSFAALLGWLLGRNVTERAMVWVWLVPSAFLIYAIVAIPTLTPGITPWELQAGARQSRMCRYFGWGCRPSMHCLDQILVTMQFYSTAAYSIAALLAQRRASRVGSATPRQFWVLLIVGFLFMAGTLYDVAVSFQSIQSWNLLLKVLALWATSFGMGAYLVLLGVSKRSESPGALDFRP
jgi:hypothetical protein